VNIVLMLSTNSVQESKKLNFFTPLPIYFQLNLNTNTERVNSLIVRVGTLIIVRVGTLIIVRVGTLIIVRIGNFIIVRVGTLILYPESQSPS